MKRLLLLSVLVLGFIPGAASSALAACYKPNCWGAIAINTATGQYAWSVNLPSQGAARVRAARKCQGGCNRALTFRNSCGAYATPLSGNGGYGWGQHPNPSVARRVAMRYCIQYNRGQGCRIRVSACTAR